MAGKSPQKILWQIPQLAQFCPPDPISAFVNQRQDKQIENGPQSGSLSGFEGHILFCVGFGLPVFKEWILFWKNGTRTQEKPRNQDVAKNETLKKALCLSQNPIKKAPPFLQGQSNWRKLMQPMEKKAPEPTRTPQNGGVPASVQIWPEHFRFCKTAFLVDVKAFINCSVCSLENLFLAQRYKITVLSTFSE